MLGREITATFQDASDSDHAHRIAFLALLRIRSVKAQTNAIYRKADVTGRPQLLSLFIDDLMGEALISGDQATAGSSA